MTAYLILCFSIVGCVGFLDRRTFLREPFFSRGRLSQGRMRHEKIIYILILASLFFLTGFRSTEIGNDTLNYIHFFNEFKTGPLMFDHEIEIGFQAFCKLIGLFSHDPRFFLVAYSFICYSLIGWYIFRNSRDIPFSLCFLFCFFFSVYTNILRQGIALILVLYAYGEIKRKKRLLPFLLIVLAGFFHKSSLFCLVLLFHSFIPTKSSFVFPFVFSVSIISLTGIIDRVIALVVPFYSGYFGTKYGSGGAFAVTGYLLITIGLYALILHSSGSAKKKRMGLVVAFFAMLCYSLAFSINLFTRMADYYLFILMVHFPDSFSKNRTTKNVFFILSVFMVFYFFAIALFRASWNNLIPYRFFWD